MAHYPGETYVRALNDHRIAQLMVRCKGCVATRVCNKVPLQGVVFVRSVPRPRNGAHMETYGTEFAKNGNQDIAILYRATNAAVSLAW